MQRRLSAPDIDFDVIRDELGVAEDYGADALDEARNASDRYSDSREDHTDIPLVTIDPPGSKDLDQALHLAADGDGFIVTYAIADVAALVLPEGSLDAESRRRGSTIYFPDRSVPLHPRVLSEGVGSLLPGVERPAVLWTIRVDAEGEVVDVAVRRALVRSVARLDYAGVSADAAAQTLHPSIRLLPRFGELRQRVALARGAIELDMPDQHVVRDADGWHLRLATNAPAEMWNSHVSLLTGMCAASIMAGAGVGLLRTLPAAPLDAINDLRSAAAAFGVEWNEGSTAGQFLAALPRDEPSTLALMSHAGTLMRGARYRALLPGGPVPPTSEVVHAAIGGLYAHVSAPLRRLGDRFATEVCLAVTAGDPVPDWVIRALPTLPKVLRSADSLRSAAESSSIDLAEAVVLADRVGERFEAVVLKASDRRHSARVFVSDPAVIAACAGDPVAATRIPVVLAVADPLGRAVEFAPVQ